MRTRKFRARNEIVDRGAVTKSQKKERKPTWRGKWESAISGKRLGNVRKEPLAVSVTMEHLETDAIRDKEDHRPLLHKKRRHRLTERYPQQVQAAEERALLEQ